MSNTITFNQLSNIGIHAPLGAVSFHTAAEKIVYLIGSTGQFEERYLSADAADRLSTLYKMRGSFGWEITGAGRA